MVPVQKNLRIKIDTTLSVQKPCLSTNYIEAGIEEDIDMKNLFRNKNRKGSISIRKAVSKIYVFTLFIDPSITKNRSHADFKKKNLEKVRFVKVNTASRYRTPDSKILCQPSYF